MSETEILSHIAYGTQCHKMSLWPRRQQDSEKDWTFINITRLSRVTIVRILKITNSLGRDRNTSGFRVESRL